MPSERAERLGDLEDQQDRRLAGRAAVSERRHDLPEALALDADLAEPLLLGQGDAEGVRREWQGVGAQVLRARLDLAIGVGDLHEGAGAGEPPEDRDDQLGRPERADFGRQAGARRRRPEGARLRRRRPGGAAGLPGRPTGLTAGTGLAGRASGLPGDARLARDVRRPGELGLPGPPGPPGPGAAGRAAGIGPGNRRVSR